MSERDLVRRRRPGRARPAHAARRARPRRGRHRRLGALARRRGDPRAREARTPSSIASDNKTFDDVLAIYRRAAEEGLDVARVHSGDPTLYGTLHEQLGACRALGLEMRDRPRRLVARPPPPPRSGRS